MINVNFRLVPAAIALCLLSANPLQAKKQPSPQKMMDVAMRCAYVTGIAEGSKVKPKYGSAQWIQIAELLEQKFGLDSEKSLNLVKQQYDKRARILGADKAYKDMLSLVKDCDREMAVILA